MGTDRLTAGFWEKASREEFENHTWQDKQAITQFPQLATALDGIVRHEALKDMEIGLLRAGMSMRLTPYVMSLIDWSDPISDPVRRQFLPMRSELEDDHPCLTLDSLDETGHSPVSGLVHRYPDKVLFLTNSVCPVYCPYCTRSYAIGLDTPLVQKNHVTSAQKWESAFAYIRQKIDIEDVVISGGDAGRLKAAHVRQIGLTLLDIPHVRRLRFATKTLRMTKKLEAQPGVEPG